MRFFCAMFLIVQCSQAEDVYSPPEGDCRAADSIQIKTVHIDTRCKKDARNAILDAVDTVNGFGQDFMCQDLISIGNDVEIYGKPDPYTIQCVYDMPYGADPYDSIGKTYRVSKYIDLAMWFLDGAKQDTIEAVTLHELTHLVFSVHGHHDSPDSVMNKHVRSKTSYTKADADFICNEGEIDCLRP